MAEILQVFPKVLHIRSLAGLDAQQPTQMSIISLKSLLGDLLRRSCFSICAPKRDCPVSLIENHPLLALASPSGTSLTARRSRSFTEMSHSLPQKPVRFGLVTAAICFEPGDDVGIKSHRNGLLRWPIELANFGSAPIDNRRSVREINVIVSFCGDSSDVSLLLLCDLPHRLSFRAIRRREPR